MQRAKVTAVTASGLYVQTADLDNIGPCQAVTATYAVGEMVLVVNVGDENRPDLVVVGKVSATGTAAHPASSTDNAVVRYDGTTGNLQDSAATLDDNGYLAAARVTSYGEAHIRAAAATNRDLRFYTDNSPRWIIRANSTAEDGTTDVGSNFNLVGYKDNGTSYTALTITRSNGWVTANSNLTVNGGALVYGGYLTIRGAAGTTRDLQFNTDSANRWVIRASNTAESPGSDAGSDFKIARITDAAVQYVALTITRSTGRVTIGTVGSTAGLEFGSSGPRMMMDTGGPNGISAPVGSTWRQTDANSTHGSLSGLLWNKVGTGTTEGTDWLVDYEGRWATYTPTWTNVSMSANTARYTVQGKTCHLLINSTLSAAPSGAVTVTLPSAASMANYEQMGTVRLRRSSNYSGHWIRNGSTALLIRYWNASNVSADLSATLPAAWASGDSISLSATYEIA